MPKYPEESQIHVIVQFLGGALRDSGNEIYRTKLSLSSTEWTVVGILYSDGPLPVTGVSDRLGRDKSLVSRDISELIRRGILCRRRDPIDRRRVVIDFAPEARDFVEDFSKIVEQRSEEFIAGLSDKDLSELRRLLILLVQNTRRSAP